MSVHKLAARCRLCPHCLACLAAAQVAIFGEVDDWTQQRVAAVVAPSSLTDCLPGRLFCGRGQASIESLAAKCARRGVAARGQDVLRGLTLLEQ